MVAAVHVNTPVVHAVDPRGLVVRRIDYCRSQAQEPAASRIQRMAFNGAGHCVANWDARLQAEGAPPNQRTEYALGGRPLSRDSVDAGFACTLFGEAGQPAWGADGLGNRREWRYDPLVRPLALNEQAPGEAWLCSERLAYAAADLALAPHNQCGRLLRHDDPAGTRHLASYALGGQVAVESRQLLIEDAWPDWPLAMAGRDDLLEPEAALTRWCHGPLGEVLEQTDASGNCQAFGQTLLGQPRQVRLLQAGKRQALTLWTATHYDAFGHVEAAVLGNGVTIVREHRAQDGRLTRLGSRRGNGDWLQDLHYAFDPAGLVVSITDQAIPVRHFANQRIEARAEFLYDSLGQLIEATGREAGTRGHGPDGALDPAAMANYRQTYRYDAGGNLLELEHVGAQAHGRELVAAARSNRCLALVEGRPPTEEDFAAAFDANGNPRQLQPGQALHWDRRNQLAGTDQERYHYDSAGQRLRKWRSQVVAGRAVRDEVRYLPSLERHRRGATGECFDVLVVAAGDAAIRVLHWQAGRPAEVPQDQCRYAVGDHLGSTSVELDGEAGLISREGYYPFGETAWHAARNEVEAGYRTLRYSGKERDASGLYYYGARYYRADWQRWLNPDPAGAVDGLNLYRMVGNSPVNRRDVDGRQGFDVLDDEETRMEASGTRLQALGLDNFPADMHQAARRSLQVARGLLGNTIAGLQRPPDEQMQRALNSTFGMTDFRMTTTRQHFLDQLRGVLQMSSDYLQQLEQGESWRLTLTQPADPNEAGVTFYSSSRGVRIAMADQRLRGNVLDSATTWIHEAMHAMTIHLSFTSPMDVVSDFWYSVLPVSVTGNMRGMLEALHGNSRLMAAFGPDEQVMSEADRSMYGLLIKREAAMQGLREPRTAEQRRDYFTTNAGIRRAVIMRNADSLAGFVLMGQRSRTTRP
ncbi:RHS repeat domain-containing protein [Pseudomonas wadenswilerensis]